MLAAAAVFKAQSSNYKQFKKNNKMKDLTTKEGRIAEMEKLENSFLITLKGNGFDNASSSRKC